MHKFAKRKVSSWFHPFLARCLTQTHFNWTYYDFVGLSEQFWITMTRVFFWSLCSLCHAEKDTRFEKLVHILDQIKSPARLSSTFLLPVISLQTEGKTHGKQELSGSFDDYFGHESFEVELLLELRTSRLWCRIQKYKGLKPSRYTWATIWTRINPFKSQNPIKLKQQMTVSNKLVLIPAVFL